MGRFTANSRRVKGCFTTAGPVEGFSGDGSSLERISDDLTCFSPFSKVLPDWTVGHLKIRKSGELEASKNKS